MKRLLKTVGILVAVLIAAGVILAAVFFLVLNQSFTDPPPPSAATRCMAPTLYTSTNFSEITSGCQCPVNPLCCPVWKREQTLSLGLTGFSHTKTCMLGGSSPCITCRAQSDDASEPESAPAR
jgi:hypothetical protein